MSLIDSYASLSRLFGLETLGPPSTMKSDCAQGKCCLLTPFDISEENRKNIVQVGL